MWEKGVRVVRPTPSALGWPVWLRDWPDPSARFWGVSRVTPSALAVGKSQQPQQPQQGVGNIRNDYRNRNYWRAYCGYCGLLRKPRNSATSGSSHGKLLQGKHKDRCQPSNVRPNLSLALFSPPPTSVPPIRGQLREPTLRQGRGTNRDNRGNRSGVWPRLLGLQPLVRGHNDRAEQESSP